MQPFKISEPGWDWLIIKIVIAWGGGTNEGANAGAYPARYRGYVIVYDADRLVPTGCFTAMGPKGSNLSSAGTHGAAIWQAGRGPVIDDDGFVYYHTGNTLPGPDTDNPNQCAALGIQWAHQEDTNNSLIKLDVKNGLSLADTTAPQSRYRQALDDCDLDLSGSGPPLIPGSSILIGGGKQGFLHVFEKRDGRYIEKSSRQVYDGPMEQYNYVGDRCETSSPNPLCAGFVQGCHHIMSGPTYWDSLSKGKLIFISAENDPVKALKFDSSGQVFLPYDDDLFIPTGNLPIVMRTSETVIGHPAANLSLSANGRKEATGILWVAYGKWADIPTHQREFFHTPVEGILHAYDAEDLSPELWNSNMCPDDALGMFAKFTPPTIANGKVYMATFSNSLAVFGLLHQARSCD